MSFFQWLKLFGACTRAAASCTSLVWSVMNAILRSLGMLTPLLILCRFQKSILGHADFRTLVGCYDHSGAPASSSSSATAHTHCLLCVRWARAAQWSTGSLCGSGQGRQTPPCSQQDGRSGSSELLHIFIFIFSMLSTGPWYVFEPLLQTNHPNYVQNLRLLLHKTFRK